MNNSQNEEQILSEQKFLALAMSEQDLKDLGMGDIAYVKHYQLNGKTAYILHAADGTALDVQVNKSATVNNAHYNELNLVALH